MKFKKSFVYFMTAIYLLLLSAPMDVSAMAPNSPGYSIALSDTQRSPDIRWQYKPINGILYRRLYNYSTKTPITDWEIVP